MTLCRCRTCSQPTCLVLANKLVACQVNLARCTPLCQEEPYRERWTKLQAMLYLAP